MKPMNLVGSITTILIVVSSVNADVCTQAQCKCFTHETVVHCDTKSWTSLNLFEFPSTVVTLTLVNNHLTFDTAADRSKIEVLPKLDDLSLNSNPLTSIPPFNNSNIHSLSLQDASITSAEFPSSYVGSPLHTISLSYNKIRSLKSSDFLALKNSKVRRLHLDSASLTTIDHDAFGPLMELQSLSLADNLLKSTEFLSTFRLLAAVNLDGNRFTSLPPEMAVPNNLKAFSFRNNSISVIDESSPLNTWQKKNWTNMNIQLANNPFDCCQSLWFIRFLSSSAHFVHDASHLTCATPAIYAGQRLTTLNPDAMNCGGVRPDKSWWTTRRIIGVAAGSACAVLAVICAVVVLTVVRRRSSRSGYTEIGGVNDPLPSVPLPPPGGLPFPPYGEDHDALSTYSTARTEQTDASQADTYSTFVGVSVADDKRV